MAKAPVIAIDGPSGSGKGTIARLLAQRLNFHLLDSGALYRLAALAAMRRDLNLDRIRPVARLAKDMNVAFATGVGDQRVWLDGEEVSQDVRSEACGAAASTIAARPALRRALLARQRAFRQLPGLVADGRDMGTIVFPDATLKIFLTASAHERAQRRYNQLKDKGIDVSLSALSRDIGNRDRRDTGRPVAPLKPADDARELDSTGMTPEQVCEQILEWFEPSVPEQG